MNQLRILPVAFICGLISIPAFAQLTTIGPNTPGVTEFTVTMEQNGTCDFSPCFFPQFTPIQPLQPTGGGVDFYSMAANGAGCFTGCPAPPNPPGLLPGFSMFDVSFEKPVTSVVALQMEFSMGQFVTTTFYPEVLAFDGQQMVASCVVMSLGGCFSNTQVVGTDQNGIPNAWNGNLTVSAPDITSVWIGTAELGGNDAEAVQFGAPEPGTFALFASALAGLVVTRRRRMT